MQIVVVKTNKNNIVKKHQYLIRNARYKLGDTAIKTLSLLISMIKVSDSDFQSYAIKLTHFKELTSANSNEVFKYVDKMTTDLMSSPFWVGNKKVNWVTVAEYEKDSGLVKFEIHRDLKPYLLELKNNFLQYNIANILVLKSGYVIRLYELCKDHYSKKTRYKKSKKSVTFDIKIDRLREQFNIPKSYLYGDIKRNILNKSVKQFKEKTDIKISFKEIKMGRRVDSLHITIRENNKGSNDFLKTRQLFIAYIRKNFVNADLLQARNKDTDKEMMISVAPDGKLYDKKGTEFDSSRSDEIWIGLYNLGKEDKLDCLKQK